MAPRPRPRTSSTLVSELADSTLWWRGPQLLSTPKLQWPETSNPHPVTELEQRAVKVHFIKLPADNFLKRFSRLDSTSPGIRLVGCLGLLARWLRYLYRPLSLVSLACSQSNVKVWDYRLCPGQSSGIF